MKIALITDTHYGVRNDSPVFHDYFDKSLNFFFQHLEDNNIKTCIHLGDLFDRRKYLNFVTAKLCREKFLERLQSSEIATHILAGNHDHYFKDSHEINSLDEIVGNRYSNILTVTTPLVKSFDGLDIQFIPWITETNSKDSYKAIKSGKCDVLMGHLHMSGFEMFGGELSHEGDDKKLYSRYDIVCSGHFHHKSSQDNVHYLGAFCEHTWSDHDDPRGFTVFDTDTRKMEFIRNPYSVFRLIKYDDTKDKDIIDTIDKMDYSQYKDSYTKIVCVNRTNPYAFDRMMENIHKTAPADISVVEDISSLVPETTDEEVIDESSAQDTKSILLSYIEGAQLPQNIEKQNMKELMADIFTEAISQEHVE